MSLDRFVLFWFCLFFSDALVFFAVCSGKHQKWHPRTSVTNIPVAIEGLILEYDQYTFLGSDGEVWEKLSP